MSISSFGPHSEPIQGLSGVEKLFYLKNKTSGEAREIVDIAPLTNDGFLIAWTQLVNQYENKRMQINAQIKTLLNVTAVNTMCSVSIRKLQRKINCCIANLNTLEIDTDNWYPIIVYLCLTKFLKEIRRKFEKPLKDCTEMPSWTAVNDVPETYPNPNPFIYVVLRARLLKCVGKLN